MIGAFRQGISLPHRENMVCSVVMITMTHQLAVTNFFVVPFPNHHPTDAQSSVFYLLVSGYHVTAFNITTATLILTGRTGFRVQELGRKRQQNSLGEVRPSLDVVISHYQLRRDEMSMTVSFSVHCHCGLALADPCMQAHLPSCLPIFTSPFTCCFTSFNSSFEKTSNTGYLLTPGLQKSIGRCNVNQFDGVYRNQICEISFQPLHHLYQAR